MSLVVAWIGIDTHGPSSAYIASESRVSWGNNLKYDCCRKTFYSKRYPEIIGYSGDVLFPSLLINSLMESVDKNLIFSEADPAIKRYEKFKKKLFNEFHKYPKHSSIISSSFEIIYINREIVSKGYPCFYAYRIKWNMGNRFYSRKIKIPKVSGILYVMGSGTQEFENNYKNYQKGRNKNTTRNVYHCFSSTLKNIKENTCGGPPQLVSIIRKPTTPGFGFGLIYKRKRYYNSLEVSRSGGVEDIQWRNDNFEICNGINKNRKLNAKFQPTFTDFNSATP